MPTQSCESRLLNALGAAGFPAEIEVLPGTAGVASPIRVATEWAGFFVSSSRGTHYAKVLHADMAPLIDVERSAQASQCAADSGAAPALILADVANGVLLFEALPAADWRWARLDELTSAPQLQALWTLKKKVHAGPAPDFTRSPMADLQKLRDLCLRDEVTLPPDHAWLNTCVDLAWHALQQRPHDSVPLHGDGVASDVMVGPGGELRLIDFDYGGCFDPWYDVAITLNELFAFENQWREGIRLWAGECREVDYAVCRLYALINNWYWTLWGLWTGATSVRGLEFSKVGQWTLLRCRQGIQDARFESWLRQVHGGEA
ncbi:phosphotransferase [Xanthomonas sp. WHRI 1810A]|uniref:phosphotransferase family protein n=1 Tax=Xanthomonas sp. WHRI 1810A TaxID=3161565 RepID=UPI0032E933C6